MVTSCCTFWRDRFSSGLKKKSLFFLFYAARIDRGWNLHSNKSARVLVRRATGRLVLSLVMANSCMPSSSATLACVRLFTSELRSSCTHKKHPRVRNTNKITLAWNNSSQTGVVMQSKCFREGSRRSLKYCIGAKRTTTCSSEYVCKRKKQKHVKYSYEMGRKERIKCNSTECVSL